VQVDPIRAELAIPESAATAVKKGQKIALSVQSFPEREFEGEIAYVGPSLKSEARTLVVEALVPNPGRLLQPGLFARARIEMPRSAPTVFVPKAAIVTDAGVSRVFVVGPSVVTERIVSVGEARGGLVEVRSGVKAGERVIVSPDRRLADGLAVAR
jgi:RND family efflux transporter MFP subunit